MNSDMNGELDCHAHEIVNMSTNELEYVPLEYAAYYLAIRQWPEDTSAEEALRVLQALNASPGKMKPVYALQRVQESRFQKAIDTLSAANRIPYYRHDPLSAIKMLPTKVTEGAFVLYSELADILCEEEARGISQENELPPIEPDDAGLTHPIRSTELSTTTHMLKDRSAALDTEIAEAIKRAKNKSNVDCIWGELIKMATEKPLFGVLVGYVSEGIQYRGKRHGETGEPDIFRMKNLRDRMSRKKKRENPQ